MSRLRVAAALAVAAGCLALPSVASVSPVRLGPGMTVDAAVRHDTSRPLRELRSRHVPKTGGLIPEIGRLPLPAGPYTRDAVRQPAATAATAAAIVKNFDGLGDGYPGFTVNAIPPDTVGAAGPTQYVQWVNSSLLVIDKKTGAAVLGPEAGNTLWTDFGGKCEANNDGDPVVNYDRFANRWVLQQFSVTSDNSECLAISTTPDATGSYHRYQFPYKAFPDYPKAGISQDAYYLTYNMFTGESGSKVCALERAAMLRGKPARQFCVQMAASITGLLPADLDGRIAPRAGTPEPIMGLAANGINVWDFHVDWRNIGRSSLNGPTLLPVAAYKQSCNIVDNAPARVETCVPQPATGVVGHAGLGLDSLSDRLMFRLARRLFPDGHESIVVTHSVDALPAAAAALRWYELRRKGSGWTVFQQGTYGPTGTDLTSRWMGSMAMDKVGNIAIGYSASSATTTFPSIRFAGRTPGDPAGTLGAEKSIVEGSGEQTTAGPIARWGDYSAMTIDPIDDCTFWYTTQYMKQVGVFNWDTKIAAIKFPTCR